MARYTHCDYGQMELVPVSFAEQILPGSFEHTLNELIDKEVDLTLFRKRDTRFATAARHPATPLCTVGETKARGRFTPRVGTEDDPAAQLHCADDSQNRQREGRYRYSRRLGIVEPVSGNIISAHRLWRFSLRGQCEGEHPVAALLPVAQQRQNTSLREAKAEAVH